MHLVGKIGLVALGSALGGLARWGVATGFARWLGASFPFGTFFINISGSFFLGWFTTMLRERLVFRDSAWLRADDLQLMIAVGFTGAYTTFSTYEYEGHAILQDGDGLAGMTYLLGSLFLGLVAVRCGILLGRWT